MKFCKYFSKNIIFSVFWFIFHYSINFSDCLIQFFFYIFCWNKIYEWLNMQCIEQLIKEKCKFIFFVGGKNPQSERGERDRERFWLMTVFLMCFDMFWCVFDVFWCVLMCFDVFWCVLMCFDVFWCVLCFDVFWCVLMCFWCVFDVFWRVLMCFFSFFSWTPSSTKKENEMSRNIFHMASDKLKSSEDGPSQGTDLEMIIYQN